MMSYLFFVASENMIVDATRMIVTDANQNQVSLETFSLEGVESAINKLKTLKGCTHCWNCEGLTNCHGCTECKNCENCWNCKYSSHLFNCQGCMSCNWCFGSKNCDNCEHVFKGENLSDVFEHEI